MPGKFFPNMNGAYCYTKGPCDHGLLSLKLNHGLSLMESVTPADGWQTGEWISRWMPSWGILSEEIRAAKMRFSCGTVGDVLMGNGLFRELDLPHGPETGQPCFRSSGPCSLPPLAQ